MISNEMKMIGAWTENILVEVLVFTCGTVKVLFFDIAGSPWTATSAAVNIFILKVEDSMPDRASWMSRMRSGQEGVSTGCGKKKQSEVHKDVYSQMWALACIPPGIQRGVQRGEIELNKIESNSKC